MKRNNRKQYIPLVKKGFTAIVFLMMLLLSSCFLVPQDITLYSSYDDEDRSGKSVIDSEKLSKLLLEDKESVPKIYLPIYPIQPMEEKSFTIMVYMNGSDLESEIGLASLDINEMIYSGFNQNNINLLIFTGGTEDWGYEEIPDNKNAIIMVEDGKLVKLAEAGEDSIANPDVLAGFINFCNKYFPAEKAGLIMWDHGGGAVAGFGNDLRYEFPDNSMFLFELDLALKSSIIDDRLEFIAFDACLMATLEVACIVDDYCRYLIASEDLVPDNGWDYSFLGDITPDCSGVEIGKLIIESFKNIYMTQESDEIITMSLTDLSKIEATEEAMNNFAKAVQEKLDDRKFNAISKAGSASRTFGNRRFGGNNSEMVDAYQLANNLKKLIPSESVSLQKAIDTAVIYKSEYNITPVGGLSVYFPLTKNDVLEDNLKIYAGIGVLNEYRRFISAFAEILTGKPIEENWEVKQIAPSHTDGKDYQIKLTKEQLDSVSEIYFTIWQHEETLENNLDYYIQLGEMRDVEILDDGTVTTRFEGTWVTLEDYWVCMYELDRTDEQIRYTIPAYLNDLDVDLIAVRNKHYPAGKVVGAMPVSDGFNEYRSRSMIKINRGDVIVPYYYAELFVTSSKDKKSIKSLESPMWYSGEAIVVTNELYLENAEADDGKYLYGFTLVDTRQNYHYTEFVSVDILNGEHKRRYRSS